MYQTFMERAGVPMPGFVYCARDVGDAVPRGRDDAGYEYLFEVRATGLLLPDEDWLGRQISHVLFDKARGGTSRPEDALTRALLTKLPADLQARVQAGARRGGGYFEWDALVGKAVIGYCRTRPGLLSQLRELAAYAATVAHQGPPQIVGLWRRDPAWTLSRVE